MNVQLILGDCLAAMKAMPPNSVDAVVTDPPYDLIGNSRHGSGRSNEPDNPYGRHGSKGGGFMGMTWDATGIAFRPETWAEVLRVLKPGGHLLAFGGTRTYHRMACAIEDAGFEIRDQLQWLYGSGFPKSLDVSKAIDKAAGVDREDKFEDAFDRRAGPTGNKRCPNCGKWLVSGSPCQCPRPQDEPVTEAAIQWDGWGTALKPANEPICMARKPLSEKNVAANVLRWGCGAINVDGCKNEYEKGGSLASNPSLRTSINGGNGGHVIAREEQRRVVIPDERGRWPANVILDEAAAELLDQQSGVLTSGMMEAGQQRNASKNGGGYHGSFPDEATATGTYGDAGGASRFFYCAKASAAERNAGLSGLPEQRSQYRPNESEDGYGGNGLSARLHKSVGRVNHHPTVKPVSLMRWLIRLVTPPNGTVLDPFAGSGTTGIAAVIEQRGFVGCEKEPDYYAIAERRIALAQSQPTLFEVVEDEPPEALDVDPPYQQAALF